MLKKKKGHMCFSQDRRHVTITWCCMAHDMTSMGKNSTYKNLGQFVSSAPKHCVWNGKVLFDSCVTYPYPSCFGMRCKHQIQND